MICTFWDSDRRVKALCSLVAFLLVAELRQSQAHSQCIAAAGQPNGGGILLILDDRPECSGDDPAWEPANVGKNVKYTTDRGRFYNLLDQYDDQSKLGGALVLQSNVCVEPFPPSGIIPAPVLTITVYDQATIDLWNATGFVPAFMNQVEVETVSLEDAVFDMDIETLDPEGLIQNGTLRVRRSDGAIAIVAMEATQTASVPDEGEDDVTRVQCNAGRWWRAGRACCFSQAAFCSALNVLLLGSCGDCAGCGAKCFGCCVSNPCHSCDPCGMTWILCGFFGGNCG